METQPLTFVPITIPFLAAKAGCSLEQAEQFFRLGWGSYEQYLADFQRHPEIGRVADEPAEK